MRRLKIPSVLQVTALSLSCSSTSPPAPPATDVPGDTAVADVTSDRGDVCVLEDSDPFVPSGFQCVRSPTAAATQMCPNERVCAANQCPAGCDGCQSPLFCIPDTLPDGGRPTSCARSLTCVLEGCGEGCRAVG